LLAVKINFLVLGKEDTLLLLHRPELNSVRRLTTVTHAHAAVGIAVRSWQVPVGTKKLLECGF